MKTFISANPILSLIIIVGIIALIVYAMKKSKNSNSANNNPNDPPKDNSNSTTRWTPVVWSGQDKYGFGSPNNPSGTGMAGMMNNSRVAGSTNSPNNFANGGGAIVQRSVPSNAH